MTRNQLLYFSLIVLVALTACNFPSVSTQRPSESNLIDDESFSAQAVDGELSDSQVPVQPDEGVEARTTLDDDSVSSASITFASEFCDQAAPGNPIDITIPDGTHFQPGESFRKTWRLINAGTCIWTQKYAVVWFSGEPMGVTRTLFFNEPVLPGQLVDITVDMVAPENTGNYQSNWKLQNPDGKLFGIGPNGDAPFWVQIQVIETTSQTPLPIPTVTVKPIVYASGEMTLLLDDRVDLDSAQKNIDGNDDIIFQRDVEDQLQLLPINGARLSVFGSQFPIESDCMNATLSKDIIILEDLDDGTYLCYQSGLGLPGYAHIKEIDFDKNVLVLEFLTWSVP